MWPKLCASDKALTVPQARQDQIPPQECFVFLDAGMVLVDLDWDAFIRGLADCFSEDGFAAQDFKRSVVSSGLLPDWECGRIGPALFVERLTELLVRSERHTGSLQRLPSMLEIKQLSSLIIGEIRWDVLACVQKLKDLGFGTGILSNASPWHETDLRLKAPLHETFDVILFSQDLGCAKPAPEIYEQAADCAHAHAKNIGLANGYREFLFIDDTPANVHAARHSGWRAALVNLLRDDDLWQHPDLEQLSRRKNNLVFGKTAAARVNALLGHLVAP